MKIIHIATTLQGGAGIGLLRYHRALKTIGADSRIVVSQHEGCTPDDIGVFGWDKAPLWQRMIARTGWGLSREQSFNRQLNRLNRGHEPPGYELFSLPFSHYTPEKHPWVREADVTVLHWTSASLDWPRFFRNSRRPVIIVLHDQNPYLGGFHYERDAVLTPHLESLEAKLVAIKRACLLPHRVTVVANSDWNARRAREREFYAADVSIETVYYPLDSIVYTPGDRLLAKRAAGVVDRDLVIGFACEQLDNSRKGFDDLLRALAILPIDLRDRLTLLSFGRAPDLTVQAGTGIKWRHLGWLRTDEQKTAAYAAMDIFAAPSRAEAFGLTALEAQSMETAVVAAPIGGLREAVADNLVGTDTSLPMPDRLAQAIITLLNSPDRRKLAGSRGRERVIQRHDPKQIGHQFHRLITQLTS